MDPDRAILERLDRIETKVDQTSERLRRVEDAVGPVEWLTKVTNLAHSRGARTDRANLVAAVREAALEAAREVLAALRPSSRDGRAEPPTPGGEPPASNASLAPTHRRRVQLAGGGVAVAVLAVTLTYASWDPRRAGDTRDSIVPLPHAPQPAPLIPPPAAPSPTRSPAAGDTQIPSAPVPGLVDRRPELLPPPSGPGRDSRDPPPLLLEPTGTPAATPGDDGCSGVGVQVRRIELCRQRR